MPGNNSQELNRTSVESVSVSNEMHRANYVSGCAFCGMNWPEAAMCIAGNCGHEGGFGGNGTGNTHEAWDGRLIGQPASVVRQRCASPCRKMGPACQAHMPLCMPRSVSCADCQGIGIFFAFTGQGEGQSSDTAA
jgi:hypothetical protein